MKCLRVDQIYLYLEGEFSEEKMKAVRHHVASCSRCQKAVEERKLLNQAYEELPLWDLPSDFTPGVMRKIFPEKVPFRSWLKALAGGLGSLVVFSLLFLLLTAPHFSQFLLLLYRSPLNLVQEVALVFAKIFKMLTLIFKIILQWISLISQGFLTLFTLIQPEIQFSLVLLFLALFSFFFYKIQRKFSVGENP